MYVYMSLCVYVCFDNLEECVRLTSITTDKTRPNTWNESTLRYNGAGCTDEMSIHAFLHGQITLIVGILKSNLPIGKFDHSPAMIRWQ